MQPTNENARREPGGRNYETTHANFKRFPAFGKQLDDLRKQGLVPRHRVFISTDWTLCGAFPRVVIPGDAPASQYIFNYLAGLHCEIVYRTNHASLAADLVDEILKVKPRSLALFNFDVAQQCDPTGYSAYRLIHSESEVTA